MYDLHVLALMRAARSFFVPRTAVIKPIRSVKTVMFIDLTAREVSLILAAEISLAGHRSSPPFSVMMKLSMFNVRYFLMLLTPRS